MRVYEPHMVLKKKPKSKEMVEEQDGWIGRIIPFELVQETHLAEDLQKLKELDASCRKSPSGG